MGSPSCSLEVEISSPRSLCVVDWPRWLNLIIQVPDNSVMQTEITEGLAIPHMAATKLIGESNAEP
jgi:hypothetical protein